MKSIVCVKRVPDSEARVRVTADGTSIDGSGVKYVMNPYDEFALEQALLLKEAAGDGLVTAITLGRMRRRRRCAPRWPWARMRECCSVATARPTGW